MTHTRHTLLSLVALAAVACTGFSSAPGLTDPEGVGLEPGDDGDVVPASAARGARPARNLPVVLPQAAPRVHGVAHVGPAPSSCFS